MMINNISYTSGKQTNFCGITFRQPKKLKLFNEIFCSAPISKNNLKNRDYFVRIENGYTDNDFSIKIDDNDFNEIGTSVLSIKNNKTIYNDNIDVNSERRKYAGAGSIMTLGEIITMLENNMEKIELHSLGQAVYFHSKFKFRPALTSADDLKDYIAGDVMIRESDKKFEKVCNMAKQWLNKDKSSKSSENYISEGNNILYQYLQTVNANKLNRHREFEIYPGFDMVLTRQNILDDKNYFNNLFKKFGIDYQISDSFC